LIHFKYDFISGIYAQHRSNWAGYGDLAFLRDSWHVLVSPLKVLPKVLPIQR